MVDQVNELVGKVAIVSGSARNIGRATAIELAKAGASLVVNARESKDLCDEVVKEIEAAGGKAICCLGDISDPGAVQNIIDDTIAAFGGVDILASSRFVRWGPSSLVARTRFFAARTTTMMSKPPSRDVKKEPAVFISDLLLSFCVSNKSVFSLLKTF